MSKERELLERVVKIANGNIIDEIKEYLAQTEQKPAPWEPKKGEWFVSSRGDVYRTTTRHCTKLFGTERQTKEAGEKASVSMRRFNRLLAYHDEFAPGFEFQHGVRNCYMYLIDNLWQVGVTTTFSPTNVYFPPWVANNLCNKLNSGEVVL
jgi:hypothetical protein